MGRTFFAAAVLAAVLMSCPAIAGEAGPSIGEISLRATLQWRYQYVQEDPGRQVEGVQKFETSRLHLAIFGEPTDKIDYMIDVAAGYGDTLSWGVYEAYIEAEATRYLSFRAGSFLPPWTLTMSDPVHELRFVRYPLVVDSGLFLFTPWRQTGVMARFHPGDNFRLNLGVFSGLDAVNLYYDNNNMKDTMVSAGVNFFPGMRVYFGHWGGRTDLESVVLAPGESAELPFGLSTTNDTGLPIEAGGGVIDHVNTWFGIEVDREPVYFAGEALWHRADRNGSSLLDSNGYQVSAGFSYQDLTALVRYEFMNPDTDDEGTGEDDELEWTTLGLNYGPAPYARLMFNYIFKSERSENQRANDEALFQVSVSF